MKTRYISKRETDKYLDGNALAEDLQSGSSIGVTSIANLIDLCDLWKQNNKTCFMEQLTKLKENHFKSGVLYLSELDRNGLFLTLFDHDDEGIVLWADASDRNIPPMHSVRRLTLRVNETVFWDDEVYQDMMAFDG